MLCGQSLPPPVYSVENSIQVTFTSLTNQYSGFNASYTAITYQSGRTYNFFFRSHGNHGMPRALFSIHEASHFKRKEFPFWGFAA